MVVILRNLICVILIILGLAVIFKDSGGSAGRQDVRASTPSASAPVVQQTAASSPITNQITLRPGRNGHFFVTAEIRGVEVEFMVDTGASHIALTSEDAERIGLNPENLAYNAVTQTANGTTPVALITLDDVSIGQIEVRDVPAIVTRAPMGISLLGMSFLGRLDGYQVENGNLILYW